MNRKIFNISTDIYIYVEMPQDEHIAHRVHTCMFRPSTVK